MPRRYFFQDPMVSGPLDFFAGLGQRRQQVADANVATQTQQNQLLGQGAGQAVSGFVGAQTADRQFQMQQAASAERIAQSHQNALALQQAYQAGRVELAEVQAANRMFQADRTEFIKQFGTTPEAVYQQAQIAQMQQTAGAGPQEAPPQQTNQTTPVDPQAIPRYRKLSDELHQLSRAWGDMQRDPSKSPQELIEAGKVIIPQISALQQQLSETKQPPPPTPEQMVKQTTWTDPATGIIYHPKDIAVNMPPKPTIHDFLRLSQEEQQSHIRSVFAGDYEKFKQRGGWGEVKADGSVDWHEPKDGPDVGKEFDEAYKILKGAQVVPKEIGAEKVLEYMRDRSRAIERFNTGRQNQEDFGEGFNYEGFVQYGADIVDDYRYGIDVGSRAADHLQALMQAFPQGLPADVPQEVRDALAEMIIELRRIATTRDIPLKWEKPIP